MLHPMQMQRSETYHHGYGKLRFSPSINEYRMQVTPATIPCSCPASACTNASIRRRIDRCALARRRYGVGGSQLCVDSICQPASPPSHLLNSRSQFLSVVSIIGRQVALALVSLLTAPGRYGVQIASADDCSSHSRRRGEDASIDWDGTKSNTVNVRQLRVRCDSYSQPC